MWIQLCMGFLGFCFGVIIASGVVAFIISLGIVPRYAGITRTAERIRLYEDSSMLGAIVGNLFFLYNGSIPVGTAGLVIYGLFAGIFLGSWIIALGEVVNIFSILARRIGLTRGVGLVVLTMALGRALGSLIYFWKGWWL